MSVAASLFTPAQARVLGRLFGSPERWYHVNELMRLTGLASASTQRELQRLERAGLVVVERVGTLKRIRANPDSPVFADLVSLVRKTMGVVPTVAESLAPLRDRIAMALVFGSVASGQEHARSDVDLLVVSDHINISDLLPALLEAEQRIDRRIEPIVFGVDEFRARRQDPGSFVSKVLARLHEVVIGDDRFA